MCGVKVNAGVASNSAPKNGTDSPNASPSVKESVVDEESHKLFLNHDTFILCNPNALSYQHMINYPHAYYLKYFLNK